MADPRHTATNAADSAPGVDDGRRGAPPPPVDARPGGRRAVMWIVVAALIILALVFIARPLGNRPTDDADGALSSAREELQISRDPDDQPAAPAAAP